MSNMLLMVNGKSKDIPGTPSLQDVIASLCKNPALVIAELNGIIIERDVWPAATLKTNDKLELVSFVGGG